MLFNYGVEYTGSYDGRAPTTNLVAKWSQFDEPDLYVLALNKMLELYKVTEKPIAYLEKSDRVEPTYPTYIAILDKNLLLQKL